MGIIIIMYNQREYNVQVYEKIENVSRIITFNGIYHYFINEND